jgi:hypothetical protein
MAEPWFVPHLRNVHSQCGEDGILERLFERLGVHSGWAVEFGAADGVRLSTTRNLILKGGWSAVLIECDPEEFSRLARNYAGHRDVHCLRRRIVAVPGHRDSLDAILGEVPVPAHFELLAVDVDGNDYHIWESLQRYVPRVVVIEFNPTIPSEVDYVQANDGGLNRGCSLRTLVRLGKTKGYELAAVTAWNAVFVRVADFVRLDLGDNSIEHLRCDASDVTYLFFGQDGTALLAGARRLPWHEVEVRESDVQLVPAILRRYPPRYSRWQRLLYKAWLRLTGRRSPSRG